MFVVGDRFARDFYHQLTGSRHLSDSLDRRGLVAVEDRRAQSATVLSASGAAPARLTLARFHAPQTCGSAEAVTELVLAFPPGGGGGRSTPPSHVTVVALLAVTPFAGGAGRARPPLPRAAALDLVTLVAQRAESISGRPRAALLRPLVLDPDQAADAGEVVVSGSRYAVGFRARFVTAQSDTLLITGVAATDQSLHALHWVMKPQRIRLRGGMMARGSPGAGLRYSVRGSVAGAGGGTLLLLDEIADVSARDSRATAIDPDTRRVVAAQPLALRCP
ncbi:MAG: hypothetical protein AUJ01_07280 [Acidobacteria bacterium 13_1_40CM_3_65_5]|nr:MAG: hypothetical protein AUJ01_07280 [Acidobacteria bacterium 13_1_40CM_3_65_5]